MAVRGGGIPGPRLLMTALVKGLFSHFRSPLVFVFPLVFECDNACFSWISRGWLPKLTAPGYYRHSASIKTSDDVIKSLLTMASCLPIEPNVTTAEKKNQGIQVLS